MPQIKYFYTGPRSPGPRSPSKNIDLGRGVPGRNGFGPRSPGTVFGLGLKAVTGPDSAEATEITEWVRTEFTENYGLPIPGFSAVTGKDEKWTIYFIFYTSIL